MIFLEPEHGATDQEAPHFIAAIIEDKTPPILVNSLARIGMFKKMDMAWDLAQSAQILRKF